MDCASDLYTPAEIEAIREANFPLSPLAQATLDGWDRLCGAIPEPDEDGEMMCTGCRLGFNLGRDLKYAREDRFGPDEPITYDDLTDDEREQLREERLARW